MSKTVIRSGQNFQVNWLHLNFHKNLDTNFELDACEFENGELVPNTKPRDEKDELSEPKRHLCNF